MAVDSSNSKRPPDESRLAAPPAAGFPAGDGGATTAPGTPLSTRGSSHDDLLGSPAAFEPSAAETAVGSLAHRLGHSALRRWDVHRTPAILISMIVHIAALLLLALFSFPRTLGVQDVFHFDAIVTASELSSAAPQLQLAASGQLAPPQAKPQDAPVPPSAAAVTERAILSELLQLETTTQQEAPISQLTQLLQTTGNHLSASFAATGVEGRTANSRRELAIARGGTIESEQAVERALQWLAAHQLPSGGWSLVHEGGECNGRCANNGTRERFDPAATGLSLLAFLGAGYTHQVGQHRETVRRGVYFLLQVLEETNQGGSFLHQSERGMYNHGIATFALSETYQLTQDPDLKRPVQQAIDFIVSAQNYQGGWGYLPKQPGDLTLTGWQVMALKSASAAGLEVPSNTILRIDSFLDTQQVESGVFYGYGKPGRSPTCTSIGLMLRLFRNMPHTDPRILEGAAFLTDLQPNPTDAYFNYYATLFLFHVGVPFWEEWNTTMRERLLKTQAASGHERGSWYFENPYGREGGRLYTTAMCTMTLEVYYRFSPLYQQADVPFEL